MANVILTKQRIKAKLKSYKLPSMKTVVITGTSRGIGLATAQKFLKENWVVIGTSTKGDSPIQNVNFIPARLDVSNTSSIVAFVDLISKQEKPTDVLINNAGIALDSWDPGVNLAKVRKTFEVNLFGLIELTEGLLRYVARDGHIINISSRYGSFNMPIDDDTSLGYRMSKAALNMHTRFLANRLADKGIKVSAIHPGWVKTDMGNESATEDAKPDREPAEAAEEIYKLAVSDIETGQFWYKNEKFPW